MIAANMHHFLAAMLIVLSMLAMLCMCDDVQLDADGDVIMEDAGAGESAAGLDLNLGL